MQVKTGNDRLFMLSQIKACHSKILETKLGIKIKQMN